MTDESSSFLARLKQHHLYGVVVTYAVVAAFLIQLVSRVFPYYGWAATVPAVITVLLLGFPVVVVLAWFFIKPRDPSKSNTWQRRHWKLSAVVTVAVIVLVVISGFYGLRYSKRYAVRLEAVTATASELKPATTSAPPAAIVIPAKSIAVLPFVNESGDKNQQYFSDGMSEDLITALSQFSELKVISRGSSFRFRNSTDSSAEIGKKLGVAYLLEGSVRRAGKMVRVTAELVNASDGSTLWSHRYDQPYKDLFKLQDAITIAAATELKTKLLVEGNAVVQSDRPPSGNLDAYTAYLRGNFYDASNTQADDLKAINYFNKAIGLDPGYASAYARLSNTWTSHAAQFLSGTEMIQAYAKARAAANTALKLDPNLAAAHVARAYLLQSADFDWSGADVEFQRALQLAPQDGRAKFMWGVLLATMGRLEPAVQLTQEALVSDPLHAIWYNWLALYLAPLGRLDEADATIRKAIVLQPDAVGQYENLTIIEVLRDDATAAMRAAQQEPPGVWRDTALALAQQISGDRAAGDTALKNLINKQAENAPYQIAEVYALRKDPDQMFAWLDRAWKSRDPGISSLLYDSLLLPYKNDPRFAAFCRKVGLPTTTEAKALP